MAERIYKQMSCRETGADCDFLVRSEKEEEVLELFRQHACAAHNLCEITDEWKNKVQIVWCEEGCFDAPLGYSICG
jgi:predicted small metal-binding protein